jgi:hypothetical protein
MILLAKLGIGLLGTAVVAGAAISSEGFIHVRVHEKRPDGANFALIVPAAVVPVALHFIPKEHFEQAPQDLQEALPIVDAAVPELEKCPDGVLVEVRDPGEHVLIAKSGGSIVIDVNDHEDTVHVSVPLRAVRSSLHQIAEAHREQD